MAENVDVTVTIALFQLEDEVTKYVTDKSSNNHMA